MSNDGGSTRNSLLDRIIAEYVQQSQAGSPLDREQLLEAHPELAAELRSFFASHEQMRNAAGGNAEDATLPPQPVAEDATIPPTPSGQDSTTPPGETAASDSATTGRIVQYFGDYELLEEIARGGMGVVYKARQINLNRIVALKMILAGQLASEEDVQRFHAEAEAAANLDHPGIVPIFEIGVHDGQHYFSMGYIEGDSLAYKVADGPLPHREAVELVKKISDAMAFAHERGVVHRDLKPANILIDGNGQPKVTDFGLVKKTEAESDLTGTGQILGTPAYMPPEQASGKTDVGPLADVYSLGAILYCLLTGRPPFQAANAMDTLLQVLNQDPVPPRQLNAQVPQDLETICFKCLHKESAKRYESATELSDELLRFLSGEPIHARPVGQLERGWRWSKRNPVVAALAAAFVISLSAGTLFSTYFGIQSRIAESAARANELDANEANKELEAALARSNYFLAVARLNEDRLSDADELLDLVPKDHRDIEWHIARRQVRGGSVVLHGHTGQVNSVHFSPDGSQVVSASFDRTLRIWNAESGEQLREIGPSKLRYSHFLDAKFSPDGKRIVSTSNAYLDCPIQLWDAESGELLKTFKGHKMRVGCLTFSPDGRRIASESYDRSIKIWEIESGTQLWTAKGDSAPNKNVSFSLDGKLVASGGHREVTVWDAASGRELRTLRPTERLGALACAFSPNGRELLTVSTRGHVTLWSTSTWDKVSSFDAGSASHLCFSPDGTRIATAGTRDTAFRIWDLRTGDEVRSYRGHYGPITNLSFSPDSARIASASQDQTIRLWSVAGERDFRGHVGGVQSVAYSPDGKQFAAGDWNTIKLWDTASAKLVRTFQGHEAYIHSLSFSSDGKRLISGSQDKSAKVWDVKTGAALATLTGHKSFVRSTSISSDNTTIATGSLAIRLWDAQSYEPIRTMEGNGDIYDLKFSPDGSHLASCHWEDGCTIWNVRTGVAARTLEGHQSGRSSDGLLSSPPGVLSTSYGPNGTLIATGGRDHTVRLWDAKSGELLRTLQGHDSPVNGITFSADEGRVFSCSDDGSIKVWDAHSGKELRSLEMGMGAINSIAIHPDGGSLVLGGSESGSVRVFDISNVVDEFRVLRGHTDRVSAFCFSPDNSMIATGGSDRSVRIWDVNTCRCLHVLEGHANGVTRVAFTKEGTHIISHAVGPERIAWKLRTGDRDFRFSAWSEAANPDATSADGRWLAVAYGAILRLVDLRHRSSGDVTESRSVAAAVDPIWHHRQADSAETKEDWFAAAFHRVRGLIAAPASPDAFYGLRVAYDNLTSTGIDEQAIPELIKVTVAKANETSPPKITLGYANRVNNRVWTDVSGANARSLSESELSRMAEVCREFPRGMFLNTLGVAYYRSGQYKAAIEQLSESVRASPSGNGLPVDLSILAMSYFQLGELDKAREFRKQLRETIAIEGMSNDESREFVAEVDDLFDGGE